MKKVLAKFKAFVDLEWYIYLNLQLIFFPQDPMIAWAMGAATGHTAIALWKDDEVYGSLIIFYMM